MTVLPASWRAIPAARLASTAAKFAQAFVRRGLHPDWGGTYFLPRVVGVAKAAELIWTGEIIEATEALRLGIVSAVHAPEDLMPAAHALAFDSQGRLFVADRSNNRVQIFDRNLQFVDEWRHFGRPSGIAILRDDTLIVADSESSQIIGGPPQAPEGGGNMVRNPGWGNGIRIGSARDGALRYYVQGTRPEGMGADNEGNVFAGLTGNCDASPSGGCLQKFVKQ